MIPYPHGSPYGHTGSGKTWLATSPATLLQLQGLISPQRAMHVFGDHVHLFLSKPKSRIRSLSRERRRARHREWQRRDRASRAGLHTPAEPEWHKGCTWCWRTIWHQS